MVWRRLPSTSTSTSLGEEPAQPGLFGLVRHVGAKGLGLEGGHELCQGVDQVGLAGGPQRIPTDDLNGSCALGRRNAFLARSRDNDLLRFISPRHARCVAGCVRSPCRRRTEDSRGDRGGD